MKKILLLLVVIVIAVIAWVFFMMPTNDYTVTIVDEVIQLEDQLSALNAAVQTGTLNPEQAGLARAQIEDQLSKITTGVNGAAGIRLTNTQEAQLQDGLKRLQQILLDYRDILVAIDTTAAKDTTVLKPRSGDTLTTRFVEAIATVENTVDEIVSEYAEDVTITEVINQIDQSTPDTLDELLSAQPADTAASTTDQQAASTTASTTTEVQEEESEEGSPDAGAAGGTVEAGTAVDAPAEEMIAQ